MHYRSLVVVAIASSCVLVTSCGQESIPRQDQIESRAAPLNINNEASNGPSIPVGFDRSAMMVTWNMNGSPIAAMVATSLPVLHFSGYNSSGESLAYTTLERLLPNQKRVAVSWKEGYDLKIDDLVPTGNLVVQDATGIRQISGAGEFVVFAEWSPTDSDILAYGYRSLGSSGIAIINVKSMERSANLAQENLNPDLFLWQDGGEAITVFQEVPGESVVAAKTEADGRVVTLRAKSFAIKLNALRDDALPSIGSGSMRLGGDSGLEIVSPRGVIKMANITGGDDNEIVVQDRGGKNVNVRFKAEQIRSRNRSGIAFVNSKGGELELYAVGGIATAVGGQIAPLAIMTTVSYYIPNPSGSTVNFTQVGQSYSGGGCRLFNHYSGTSMAYAIDIQISGSSYDSVLASANGTTVSGYSWVTCNSADTSGCAIYSNPCSCNGGWGNYVILSHADGYYTKYTHLESANFQVHTCGASASAGCWLANEGGTGASSGSKNGCGDHLHFQKQTGSGLNDTSAPVSFVEDSTITSSDCTSKYPAHGAMSCSL